MANAITILRMILGPVVGVILFSDIENKELFAFVIFVVVALSDAVDGYVARKYGKETKLGKLLDPLADKFLVIPALLALVTLEWVQPWAAAVIILREVFIAFFRYYFHVKDSTFSPSWIAKKKTTAQFVAIGVLLLFLMFPEQEIILGIGTYALYVAVILTVYSGAEYIIKYSKTARVSQ